MNTSKRKRAEQPAPIKDPSVKRVREVALMLYARQPFPQGSRTSEWEWDSLITQALAVLDNLDKAYGRVWLASRKGRRVEKELPFNADGRVPYEEAVMFITRQDKLHITREEKLELALLRFKALPLFAPLGSFGAELQKPKGWSKQIAHWHKNGMTRDEVIMLHSLYDEKNYRRWRTGARKQWSKKRLKKAQDETYEREAEKEKS